MAKMGKWTKLALCFAIVGTILLSAILLQLYTSGADNTHTYNIDFSRYMAWVAVFGVIFSVAFVTTLSTFRGKGSKKYRKTKIVVAIIFGIGLFVVLVNLSSALRAWNDNSKTASIAVTDGTDEDFLISDPKVESYHDKDDTYLNNFPYIITFDDRYRITINLNCTNFTDGEGNNVQLYNDTTIKLRGFNILKQRVTGWYSPDEQPGDFEITEETPKFIVFSDIPRRADDPSKQIAYYQINLYNEDGDIIATWYIVTSPDLTKWDLRTTV